MGGGGGGREGMTRVEGRPGMVFFQRSPNDSNVLPGLRSQLQSITLLTGRKRQFGEDILV